MSNIDNLKDEEYIGNLEYVFISKSEPNGSLFALGTAFLTIGTVILVNGLNSPN